MLYATGVLCLPAGRVSARRALHPAHRQAHVPAGDGNRTEQTELGHYFGLQRTKPI